MQASFLQQKIIPSHHHHHILCPLNTTWRKNVATQKYFWEETWELDWSYSPKAAIQHRSGSLSSESIQFTSTLTKKYIFVEWKKRVGGKVLTKKNFNSSSAYFTFSWLSFSVSPEYKGIQSLIECTGSSSLFLSLFFKVHHANNNHYISILETKQY